MAHRIVEGWTVEVRDADTKRIEFVRHFRTNDQAQEEAHYWEGQRCEWSVSIYCNGCFQGTEEV